MFTYLYSETYKECDINKLDDHMYEVLYGDEGDEQQEIFGTLGECWAFIDKLRAE